MPVRSLHSSVLKWPDKPTVDQAAREWAHLLAAEHPEIIGIAYFGSYARGDWGVGSDLDVVIIIRNSTRPLEERGCDYDTQKLPVPTDLVVYTLEEWSNLDQEQPFYRRLLKEAVWVFGGL
jgi:predicted nucleotidyltransferase